MFCKLSFVSLATLYFNVFTRLMCQIGISRCPLSWFPWTGCGAEFQSLSGWSVDGIQKTRVGLQAPGRAYQQYFLNYKGQIYSSPDLTRLPLCSEVPGTLSFFDVVPPYAASTNIGVEQSTTSIAAGRGIRFCLNRTGIEATVTSHYKGLHQYYNLYCWHMLKIQLLCPKQ